MQVIPGENAENAGMEKGDIIVEVNGKKIMDTDDLSNILKELEVGKTAEVYVVRNGDTSLKLDVVIGDMNNMAE
jgi:S1-C subfamily serine protease